MIDLYQFVRTNKKVAIWVTFFGLLFLVRKVFGLLFLTFLLCYIFNNAIVYLERRTRLRRHFWTVFVYLIFASAVIGLLLLALPSLINESRIFLRQLPESLDGIHLYLDRLAQKQPQAAPFLEGVKDATSINNLLGINREALVDFVLGFFNRITHFTTYFLLATLFSFLIVFDFPNLRTKVLALRQTRFQDAYDETADSVAKFALVVGFTFQAQILIAILNTGLTALGLWILKIGTVALLSSIVFFAGLIPVAGTFISSVPILLLAFNQGGIEMAGKTVGMIVIVHVVEAYILNPNIVSAVLKINPLLTLIILYVGHTLFGIWGVLLGVPVAVYVYRYIIMRPADIGAEDLAHETAISRQVRPKGSGEDSRPDLQRPSDPASADTEQRRP
jgi:predicted PurR-regulated permease PerM